MTNPNSIDLAYYPIEASNGTCWSLAIFNDYPHLLPAFLWQHILDLSISLERRLKIKRSGINQKSTSENEITPDERKLVESNFRSFCPVDSMSNCDLYLCGNDALDFLNAIPYLRNIIVEDYHFGSDPKKLYLVSDQGGAPLTPDYAAFVISEHEIKSRMFRKPVEVQNYAKIFYYEKEFMGINFMFPTLVFSSRMSSVVWDMSKNQGPVQLGEQTRVIYPDKFGCGTWKAIFLDMVRTGKIDLTLTSQCIHHSLNFFELTERQKQYLDPAHSTENPEDIFTALFKAGLFVDVGERLAHSTEYQVTTANNPSFAN